MIRFQCPQCKKKLGVDESQAGKVGACPDCKTKFRIQAAPTVDEITTTPRKKPAPSAEDDELPPPVRKRRRVPDDEEVAPDDDGAIRKSEGDEPAPHVRKRRRLEDDEEAPDDDEDVERRPSRRKKKKKRRKTSSGLPLGLDGFTVALIGAGVFGLLSIVPALIWPAASYLPIGLGWLLSIVGGLWFVVVAFQEDSVQGLLCIFVPFYSLYFLITHFDEAKRPFFVQMVGTVILMGGSCAGAFSGYRANVPPNMRGVNRPALYAIGEPDGVSTPRNL